MLDQCLKKTSQIEVIAQITFNIFTNKLNYFLSYLNERVGLSYVEALTILKSKSWS